jgi:hypothetical protein
VCKRESYKSCCWSLSITNEIIFYYSDSAAYIREVNASIGAGGHPGAVLSLHPAAQAAAAAAAAEINHPKRPRLGYGIPVQQQQSAVNLQHAAAAHAHAHHGAVGAPPAVATASISEPLRIDTAVKVRSVNLTFLFPPKADEKADRFLSPPLEFPPTWPTALFLRKKKKKHLGHEVTEEEAKNVFGVS